MLPNTEGGVTGHLQNDAFGFITKKTEEYICATLPRIN